MQGVHVERGVQNQETRTVDIWYQVAVTLLLFYLVGSSLEYSPWSQDTPEELSSGRTQYYNTVVHRANNDYDYTIYIVSVIACAADAGVVTGASRLPPRFMTCDLLFSPLCGL